MELRCLLSVISPWDTTLCDSPHLVFSGNAKTNFRRCSPTTSLARAMVSTWEKFKVCGSLFKHAAPCRQARELKSSELKLTGVSRLRSTGQGHTKLRQVVARSKGKSMHRKSSRLRPSSKASEVARRWCGGETDPAACSSVWVARQAAFRRVRCDAAGVGTVVRVRGEREGLHLKL